MTLLTISETFKPFLDKLQALAHWMVMPSLGYIPIGLLVACCLAAVAIIPGFFRFCCYLAIIIAVIMWRESMVYTYYMWLQQSQDIQPQFSYWLYPNVVYTNLATTTAFLIPMLDLVYTLYLKKHSLVFDQRIESNHSPIPITTNNPAHTN